MKFAKNIKRAFTLIELLIVIAIIGILFIVLVSKVDFATDKAKATGVQTDFRSFQVAFETVAKENAGFNIFGWDTGDANGDRIRNSYDRGDTNQNGKEDAGETFIGRKEYGEAWTTFYTMLNPDTTKPNDDSAFVALEAAINANLDPKLHITITPDVDGGSLTGNATITMANQARDPWKNEYHGVFITNAARDNGADRGAIIIYSNGANGKWGSAHDITNGVVSVTVPYNNKLGQDDYSLSVAYTYVGGFGEVESSTTGFSNNQGSANTNIGGNGSNGNNPGSPESPSTNTLGITLNKVYSGSGFYVVFTDEDSATAFVDLTDENLFELPFGLLVGLNNPGTQFVLQYSINDQYIEFFAQSSLGNEALDITLKFDSATNTLINEADDITLTMSNKTYSSYYINTTYYSYMLGMPDLKINASGKFTDLYGNVLPDLQDITIIDHVIYSSGFAGGYLSMDGKEVYMYDSGIDSFVKAYSLTSPADYVETREPGLYQSGSNYTIKLKTWDELLASGALTVENGMLYTYIHPANTSWEIGTNPSQSLLSGDLVIPEGITRLGNVQGVGDDCPEAYVPFWGCSNLTGVVLPSTLTQIDYSAFMACTALETVAPVGYDADIELSYNITSIEGLAFYACTNLKIVVLPNSVTKIGRYGFGLCSSITTFMMSSNIQDIEPAAFIGFGYYSQPVEFICTNNNKYEYVNGCLIDTTTKTLVWGNTNAVIPTDGRVVTIGESAFEEMKIETITIPKSVTKIEYNAFRFATSLEYMQYEGTVAEWNAIQKEEFWMYPVYISYVQCSDGRVNLQ